MSSLIAIVPSFASCKRLGAAVTRAATVPVGLAAASLAIRAFLDLCV